MPRRLMVGQQPLELFTVVRIHAGQHAQPSGRISPVEDFVAPDMGK